MDHNIVGRRELIGGSAVLALAALLPGCATDRERYSLTEVIRRLLEISSERAFSRLLAPDGFLTDELARLDVPSELGGGRTATAVGLLLSTRLVQDRLRRQLNRAASEAAADVAPFVADSVRTLTVQDAAAILSGAPDSATRLLRATVYGPLVDRLFPLMGESLRDGDAEIIAEALRVATGVDFSGLTRRTAERVGDSIFRAIAREEEGIRADPRSTRDPMLIGALTLARRGGAL